MEQIIRKLQQTTNELYGIKPEVILTVAPEKTGADYATNLAMQLAKLVHKAPMQIAEEIAEKLRGEDAGFEVQVAQPGFLNFCFDNNFLAKKIAGLADGVNKPEQSYAGKVVVCEFSDPNPFKVLHVGHFYTSVVGDSISRLLEVAGAKVVRANFGGDVGLHVGKTLWAVMQKGLKPESLTIEDLAENYVEGTRAYEEDEQAKQEIIELNKAIYKIAESGENSGELAELYWAGREISYNYFKEFYQKIGVEFDKYYPESVVAGRGLKEVREHTGSVYEDSDGAVVYRGEKVGLHTRVFISNQGVPTYEAKDVGLIFTKWDDWKFDESVVITGNEIIDYMKVVLASISEYAPKLVERTRHLTHGMVKLPGSVKMSSRKGNFLKAVDVLEMVQDELASGRADSADMRIVLAAIKYAFLKYRMGGDIVFDPQESVAMNGNSGVYLLYSVVRAKKILQKAGGRVLDVSEISGEGMGDVERKLCQKLSQYQETLDTVIAEKAPNKLCTWLYELAQEFSRFYENVQVAGSERENELMTVVQAYVMVMEHGLDLLGISVPEEM